MKKPICFILVFISIFCNSASAKTVRIVYKPDKTVVVIHPAPKSKKSDETEEQWLERVFTKSMQKPSLKGLPYDDIDSSQLPQTRIDRNAWEGAKGKGITVNQVKAQQIRDAKQLEIDIKNKLRAMVIRELNKP